MSSKTKKLETNWSKERADKAKVAACQEMCLYSYKKFVQLSFRYVYRKKFVWSKHHDTIARELMMVWTGKVQNEVINIPPRYSKTEMLMLFVAWAYGHNPSCEFLHLSYSGNLAVRNSDKVRQLMKSQFYQDMFGVELDPAYDSKGEWRTKAGGIFYATATGGQVTGFGAGATDEFDENGKWRFSGALLIDDPLKPEDAYSDTIRSGVNTRWESTIKNRRNSPKTTPTICIMQRLHERDFTYHLLSDEEEDFRHVKMPAITSDGTALWESKHTVEMIESMMERDVYTTSAQYMQDPTPAGGGIFKKDWFRRWDVLPERFEKIVVFSDTAGETKKENDYSVFQLWGLFENKAYLIDQIRGKWESPEMVSMSTRTFKRWKKEYPPVRALKIEKAAVAIGFIQTIKRQIPIPVLPINRHKDKVTRAYSTAPYIQSGMVMFPPQRLGFAEDFEKEVGSFTANDSHANDDQCDPMFDAVSEFFIKPEVAGSMPLKGGS